MRKVNARDWKTGEIIHENVTFHQFGLDVVEYESTAASYSVAILELHNGTVVNWDAKHIQFINDETEQSGSDDRYYIQDARKLVGNDMIFWQLGGGYTTDVSKAELFTKDCAMKQHRDRESDIPWPKEYIDRITRPVVDIQNVDRDFSLTGKGL